MEPIPETREVLADLEPLSGSRMNETMARVASLARERVPTLVGLSLSLLEEDLVLTYVATDTDVVGVLDGVQYADDGPCLEAARSDTVVHSTTQGLLDEEQWRLFAQCSAAAGVASTLSLPIKHDGRVTGGVNLYGARADTFDGHVQELAALFGAWSPGAVANADLSFDSRLQAIQAPQRLQDQAVIDRATGILAGTHRVQLEEAGARLRRAAARAGITPVALARALEQSFEPGS
jgi:GAF domain-containing protein